MTTIILTRHGHVGWITPERFRGRAPLPLSELGKRQAQALGARIAAQAKPNALYTSPLSRCVETGAAIGQATGLRARVLDELVDTDYGQWQGMTHEEVRALWPKELRMWFDAPEMALIPGGESLAEVLGRATHVVRKMLQEHRDQTVVLVGHDSINRVLLLLCLGLPLSHYWRIKQTPCCINELDLHDHSATIHRINDHSHTEGLPTMDLPQAQEN